MDRTFLADAMLGSLARWLRALGLDTHYQRHYKEGTIAGLLGEGRSLLSRNRRTIGLYPGSVLIRLERVGEQVQEMRGAGLIHSDPERWFTRCLICNVSLEKADARESLKEVPEYVFHQRPDEISRCPSCGRFFWPGTHKERMIMQLREWGF